VRTRACLVRWEENRGLLGGAAFIRDGCILDAAIPALVSDPLAMRRIAAQGASLFRSLTGVVAVRRRCTDEVGSPKGESVEKTKRAQANRAGVVPDRQSLAHTTGRNKVTPCRISSRKGVNYDRESEDGISPQVRTWVFFLAHRTPGEACRFTTTTQQTRMPRRIR
jgi:hypothetical protein